MAEEQSLHGEILGVCRGGLKNTFVDQSEADERKYTKLARICENVERDKWENWERPQALISAMRRAIELMPDEKPSHCPVSWKHIARTLCGFRSDIELRPGEVEFSYKMDYLMSEEVLEII